MSDKKLTWQEAVLFLKDLGITSIHVHYEGSGDSGSIEDVEYYTGENGETVHFKHDLNISDEMHEKLINLCYPMLDDIEDWYNNDGGYGTVVISFEDDEPTINVDGYVRELTDAYSSVNLVNIDWGE